MVFFFGVDFAVRFPAAAGDGSGGVLCAGGGAEI